MIHPTTNRALAAARSAGAVLVITLLSIAGCQGGNPGEENVGTGKSGAGCAMGCTTAADCADSTAPPAFDASHFACADGACQYLGCQNDTECSATHGEGWACKAVAGAMQPACVDTCAGPADCVAADAPPALDASHFACTAGVCRYLGCKGHQDCTSTNGPGWECRTPPGAAAPTCVHTCSAAADCAVPNGPPIADASHFTCAAGVCEHLGCMSDQECVPVIGQGGVCM